MDEDDERSGIGMGYVVWWEGEGKLNRSVIGRK